MAIKVSALLEFFKFLLLDQACIKSPLDWSEDEAKKKSDDNGFFIAEQILNRLQSEQHDKDEAIRALQILGCASNSRDKFPGSNEVFVFASSSDISFFLTLNTDPTSSFRERSHPSNDPHAHQ